MIDPVWFPAWTDTDGEERCAPLPSPGLTPGIASTELRGRYQAARTDEELRGSGVPPWATPGLRAWRSAGPPYRMASAEDAARFALQGRNSRFARLLESPLLIVHGACCAGMSKAVATLAISVDPAARAAAEEAFAEADARTRTLRALIRALRVMRIEEEGGQYREEGCEA